LFGRARAATLRVAATAFFEVSIVFKCIMLKKPFARLCLAARPPQDKNIF